MKVYPENSPQALARVLAMTMITDAKLADQELQIMDQLFLYEVLEISKSEFAEVVKQYCDDLLVADPAQAKVDLMDRARIDAVLAPVTDPQKRFQTAQMIANVIRADGHLHDAELALFRHVLQTWNLTLDALKGMVRPAQTQSA